MANRNNVNTKTASEDNDDDIPNEVVSNMATPSYTSNTANGNVSTTGGMSLEELDEKGMNETRDEELRAALDPPAGDWLKTERVEKWEKRVYANDNAPDDLDPAGRTIFSYEVKVMSRTMGQHTYTPKLFLRVSPDARFKADKPEEVDMATKLWLRAKDLYFAVKEERPTIRKLVYFLAEDDYTLRTMKGDSNPVVVDVKRTVVRPARR